MNTIIAIICGLILIGVLYWQLVIKIGKEQELDWIEFKKQYPNIFKTNLKAATKQLKEKE